MRKIKTVAAFAVIGFLISFVFGLFSGKNVVFILLEALIFAVVFGILGFGIGILFEKFLLDDSGNDITSDSPVINENHSANTERKGQYVDLTIQDEELPEGSSQNRFDVNSTHQMLNNSDVMHNTAATPAAAEPVTDENPGFVPLKNFETINTISSKEAVSPEQAGVSNEYSEQPASDDKDIDVLPDMENFSFGSSSSSEDTDDSETLEMGEATSFSSSGSGSGNKTLEDVGIQDAALMAKAISSALSNDES